VGYHLALAGLLLVIIANLYHLAMILDANQIPFAPTVYLPIQRMERPYNSPLGTLI